MAQNIVGSTSVDIDQNSGAGTATCETDLDAESQAYYEAIVNCSVVDSIGTAVAVGQYVDHNNQQGFAQVVLTFTGVTGTTYTATGVHRGEMYLGDYSIPAPGQPAQFNYSDLYNFGYFEGSNNYYQSFFDWVGPGPERQTRKSSVQTGNTYDMQTVQKCPTSISLDQVWTQPLQNDYPTWSTGVGILTRMKVGPVGTDFTSVVLSEIVTPTGDSCPSNIQFFTSFSPITYGSNFIVRQSAGWEGNPYPSVQNAFYDSHRREYATNILGNTNVTSCRSTAVQDYTCNDRVVGTFTLTYTFYSGFINAQPVTFVSASKQ